MQHAEPATALPTAGHPRDRGPLKLSDEMLARFASVCQGTTAASVILLAVGFLGYRVPRELSSGLLLLCIMLFLAGAIAFGYIAHGTRRIVLLALGATALFGAIAQAAAARHVMLDLPAGSFPIPGMRILLFTAHPALLIGLASAIGWRRRSLHTNVLIDTMLLVAAAAIVGIWLGFVAHSPAEAQATEARTFLFFWRWLPMAELMLVALLLAVHGDRLGRRTAVGLALGTVAFAIAASLHGRLALENPTAALTQTDPFWTLCVLGFSLTLDVGAIRSDERAGADGDELGASGLDIARLRDRLIVVAILIAAASTVALGFRRVRSPELAVVVAVFTALMALRAWRTLHQQERETRDLTLSVTAERAVATVLETRVESRTRELAEARRVLQRMWVLGQQITLELNPTRVLQRFVEAVADIAQSDGASLGLLAEDGKIRLVAATGVLEGIVGQTVPVTGSAMGRVMRSGKSWGTGDLPSEPRDTVYRPENHAALDAELRSIMVYPLLRRGETSGAIAIVSRQKDKFGSVHSERIESMTDMLSVALSNAELVENLRQAEWRFRTLFRAAPDAVLTVLQSGRIREANDAVRDIVGLDPIQVVGRFIVDFVVDADRDRLHDALDAAFARGPSRLEVRFAREGSARVVAIVASRLPEADPPTVLVTGRDITSEREMRSRLMETERLAAVGELVAGVAHEVNNPLSSISAFAQLLVRDGGLTPTQRDSIDVIKSEAIRASQVVKDLLAFARRSEPRRDPLDLNQLVDRTLRLRGFELNASRIKIEPSLALDLPAVLGDARQLQQVILNLITNALQAMAAQGGGTLGVATRYDLGRVILEVSDTGPGIPSEARERIFEPFFTTKEEGEGTGLGLSVSYGIVSAHGGTIDLAEVSEKGTRFVVTLPAVSDAPLPEPPGDPRLPATRSPLWGLRLLFVDDEPSMRAGVEAFGRLRGFEVVTAGDGKEAMAHIHSTGFDAVVTDIRMPEMDGLQLYDTLRRERPGLAARLIFITGDVVSSSGQFAAAKQPTLTKPFSFERLEEMLISLVRGQPVSSDPVPAKTQ